jgi:hypothetical protein
MELAHRASMERGRGFFNFSTFNNSTGEKRRKFRPYRSPGSSFSRVLFCSVAAFLGWETPNVCPVQQADMSRGAGKTDRHARLGS